MLIPISFVFCLILSRLRPITYFCDLNYWHSLHLLWVLTSTPYHFLSPHARRINSLSWKSLFSAYRGVPRTCTIFILHAQTLAIVLANFVILLNQPLFGLLSTQTEHRRNFRFTCWREEGALIQMLVLFLKLIQIDFVL